MCFRTASGQRRIHPVDPVTPRIVADKRNSRTFHAVTQNSSCKNDGLSNLEQQRIINNHLITNEQIPKIIEIHQTRLQKGGYFQHLWFSHGISGSTFLRQVTSWWPRRSVQARDSSANKCRPPDVLKLRENSGKNLGKQGLKHKLKPRFVFFNAEIGVKAVDVPIQFYEY